MGAPFGPVTCVELGVVLAEQVRSEQENGGRYARTASCHHRLVELHPGFIESGAELVAALPAVVGVEQPALRHILRARDMPRDHARTRPLLLARKAGRG